MLKKQSYDTEPEPTMVIIGQSFDSNDVMYILENTCIVTVLDSNLNDFMTWFYF